MTTHIASSRWYSMDEAPCDGTIVEAIDIHGNITLMQHRQFHPNLPIKKWLEPSPQQNGFWTVHICVYPVVWRPYG